MNLPSSAVVTPMSPCSATYKHTNTNTMSIIRSKSGRVLRFPSQSSAQQKLGIGFTYANGKCYPSDETVSMYLASSEGQKKYGKHAGTAYLRKQRYEADFRREVAVWFNRHFSFSVVGHGKKAEFRATKKGKTATPADIVGNQMADALAHAGVSIL